MSGGPDIIVGAAGGALILVLFVIVVAVDEGDKFLQFFSGDFLRGRYFFFADMQEILNKR